LCGASEDAMAPCHPNAISMPLTVFRQVRAAIRGPLRFAGGGRLTGLLTLGGEGHPVMWWPWNESATSIGSMSGWMAAVARGLTTRSHLLFGW